MRRGPPLAVLAKIMSPPPIAKVWPSGRIAEHRNRLTTGPGLLSDRVGRRAGVSWLMLARLRVTL